MIIINSSKKLLSMKYFQIRKLKIRSPYMLFW